MGQTLLRKVWDLHTVRRLPTGRSQLFMGLHLIHEVTTPQAFDMLRRRGVGVAFPERTYGTVDHIIPTLDQERPFADDPNTLAAVRAGVRQVECMSPATLERVYREVVGLASRRKPVNDAGIAPIIEASGADR